MNWGNFLLTLAAASIFFLFETRSAESGRDVKVLPVAKASPSRAEGKEAPPPSAVPKVEPDSKKVSAEVGDQEIDALEAVSKEAKHYQKRKAFIEELRDEAAAFRRKLDGVKDTKERLRKTEEFRMTRAEKIKRFIEEEKNIGVPSGEEAAELFEKG